MNRVLPALILLAAMGLSACETMQGFGRDLQNAGETIEDEAS